MKKTASHRRKGTKTNAHFLKESAHMKTKKKNLLRTNGQRKRLPVTQCENLTNPFVKPEIGPQIMTIDPPRQPRAMHHSFHSLALSPLTNPEIMTIHSPRQPRYHSLAQPRYHSFHSLALSLLASTPEKHARRSLPSKCLQRTNC